MVSLSDGVTRETTEYVLIISLSCISMIIRYHRIYTPTDEPAKICDTRQNKVQNMKTWPELSHPGPNIDIYGIIL